jgi:hypothetical protein
MPILKMFFLILSAAVAAMGAITTFFSAFAFVFRFTAGWAFVFHI